VRVTEVDRQTCRARLVPPSDSPVGRHHPGSRGLITSARVVDRNYWARIGNSLRNSALDRRVDRRLRVGRQCGPRLSRRCGCDVREDLRCPGTCRPRFRLSPGQSLRFLAALPVRSMQAPGVGNHWGRVRRPRSKRRHRDLVATRRPRPIAHRDFGLYACHHHRRTGTWQTSEQRPIRRPISRTHRRCQTYEAIVPGG